MLSCYSFNGCAIEQEPVGILTVGHGQPREWKSSIFRQTKTLWAVGEDLNFMSLFDVYLPIFSR